MPVRDSNNQIGFGCNIHRPSQLVNVRLAPTLPVLGSLVFVRGFAMWAAKEEKREDHPWQTRFAIFGHPDIPCFLLLDDPADE
jgi:hypothetical protein